MSLPHLLSLSNELLIEIISNLGPVDIYACQCTCRGLNEVIVNSILIQYVKRTGLNGVFDPLEPGLSWPDRLKSLERWENAWMEMDLREPNAIIKVPLPVSAVPVRGPKCLSEQYFIMSHQPESGGASACYSFLDIQTMSSHNNPALWTTIEIDIPRLILRIVFASELNLAVVVSTPSIAHRPETIVTISFLLLGTGEPHPLASQPELEVSVSGSAAYNLSNTIIIGDYILYSVGEMGSRALLGSLCGMFLVAWKEGWVSKIWTSLPGVYSRSLSVLSEQIILLVRHREPALELCRLSNINGREEASLETVCILSLPTLTEGASLWWTICFDEHPGQTLFSKTHQQHPSLHAHALMPSSSGLSTQRPEEDRINTRCHLHSTPLDGIIVIVMHISELPVPRSARMIDLTVRRRTLLEFCNAEVHAGALGAAFVVPWEQWGPIKTHILKLDPYISSGSLIGERRVTLTRSCITIRDYNPFRVHRALKLIGGAEKEVTLECGSVVKVVKEKLVYRGGQHFCDNIETNVPYVQTVVPYNSCNEILMDQNNLLVVQREPGNTESKFYLHYL